MSVIDKLDSSKLKRDYIINPLKKIKIGRRWTYEKPHKKDLEYLYNECNFSLYDLYEYFSYVSHHTVQRWISFYNIRKDKDKKYNNIANATIKKYGIKNYNNREKYKKTCLEKYGVEYYVNHDKAKKTCLEKYGVENPSYSILIKDKIRNKSSETQIKMKKTCLEKYGVDSAMKSKLIRDKRMKTMILNKSFNKSICEEKIYELLCKKFDIVYRQYNTLEYPYNCDFYIPIINTYIEYQGFYMHGGEPYTGNKKQINKLKLWESKNSPQYKRAIKIWTITDPQKRKTAKKNKLNWLEFFNMKQFMDWYNNQ